MFSHEGWQLRLPNAEHVVGERVFKEHEQVVPTADILGDDGVELKRGDAGAIVHVHHGEEAPVVEFMALDGDTVDIATVLPSQARPVTGKDLTHARNIEITV